MVTAQLQEAVFVAGVGMTTVFVFLGCLVLVLSLLPIFFGDRCAQKSTSLDENISGRRKRAAAIAVALYESERERGQFSSDS